jgi:hypothetical protein
VLSVLSAAPSDSGIISNVDNGYVVAPSDIGIMSNVDIEGVLASSDSGIMPNVCNEEVAGSNFKYKVLTTEGFIKGSYE